MMFLTQNFIFIFSTNVNRICEALLPKWNIFKIPSQSFIIIIFSDDYDTIIIATYHSWWQMNQQHHLIMYDYCWTRLQCKCTKHLCTQKPKTVNYYVKLKTNGFKETFLHKKKNSTLPAHIRPYPWCARNKIVEPWGSCTYLWSLLKCTWKELSPLLYVLPVQEFKLKTHIYRLKSQVWHRLIPHTSLYPSLKWEV